MPRLLRLSLFATLLALVAGLGFAQPARAGEHIGPGYAVQIPDDYEAYPSPDRVHALLARLPHVLVRPGPDVAVDAVFIKGDALSPEGLLVVGRVPTSELDMAGDLDAYERMLRRTAVLPGGVALDVSRHPLVSGESALLAQTKLPTGTASRTPDARTVLAPNDPQHRTLLIWVGRASEGGATFGKVLGSLRVLPRPDRVQQVTVWGTLALLALGLLVITLIRIRSSRRGGIVDFGRSQGTVDTMPSRATDGLPTFGVGAVAGRPHIAGPAPTLAPSARAGAPSGLRPTGNRAPGPGA
ncbi:MAG: hypothetical protein AB7T63_06260 [Planctomycetota bacterium]